MTTQKQAKWLIPTTLILLGLTARILPHPANFAPIGAIALFGGLYLPKKLALATTLLSLFISDLIIGTYNPKTMLVVYLSFALVVLIGFWIRKNKSFGKIIGGTLLGSIIFFLTTNAAVWAFGTMYSHNLNGLLQSYTLALPFFRNSLAGDFFYVFLLVGSAEYIFYRLPKLRASEINV